MPYFVSYSSNYLFYRVTTFVLNEVAKNSKNFFRINLIRQKKAMNIQNSEK